MLGKLFSKAKSGIFGAAAGALDAGQKDVMEAMMASCALVAYADGDVSDAEIDQTCTQIENSEQLANMADEAKEVFMTYVAKLEKTGRLGKRDVMKEITDLANDTSEENRVRVLLIGIEVADSEDGIDEDEMKVLKSIAAELKLSDKLSSLI